MPTPSVELSPAALDIHLYQGDTLAIRLSLGSEVPAEEPEEEPTFEPYDLDGVVVAAQIRLKPRAEEILASFTCEILDPAEGLVEAVLTAPESSKVIKDAVWDLQTLQEVEEGEPVVRTWLAGSVSLTHDVTRLEAGNG